MVRIIDIDQTAGALTRYRFLRTYIASAWAFSVLFMLGFLALFSPTLVGGIASLGLGYSPLPILFEIMILMALPYLALSFVVAALLERTHRRINGIMGLAYLSGIAATYGASVFKMLEAALQLVNGRQSPDQLGPLVAVGLISFLLLFNAAAIWIAVELVIFFGWTTVAAPSHYFAMRGWRPRLSQVFANARRQLGFPSFVSSFGERAGTLTAVHLGLGALNTLFLVGFLMISSATVALDSLGWVAPKGDLQSLESIKQLVQAPNSAHAYQMNLEVLAGIVLFLAVLLITGLGRWLTTQSRQRATRIYQNVRDWDTRRPILFLRWFGQDQYPIPVLTRSKMLTLPAGIGRAQTLDEILLETGSAFGPVIAIGDPRDPTPPLGAARVFVRGKGNGWQDVVRALAEEARAIVICPNRTQGVAWELDLVADPQMKQRTIYLTGPVLSQDEGAAMFDEALGLDAQTSLRLLKRPLHLIAAFCDPQLGWTVLVARRLSVQTLTVATNFAMQSVVGAAGVKLTPLDEEF